MSTSRLASLRGVALLAAPFRRMARLLSTDVRLERKGRRIGIRVAAPPPEPSPPDSSALEAQKATGIALKKLLDTHRQTRRVMRHLGYLERALAARGQDALNDLPVEVIAKALKQFEALVSNWSDPVLAGLRSQMAVAVLRRSDDPFGGPVSDRRSEFYTDSRLEVRDDSPSAFMEFERAFEAHNSRP
jgi:hypothetical protein